MTFRRRDESGLRRKLAFESLESRRLMACGAAAPNRLVTTTEDSLDSNTNTWSLREAIIEANDKQSCNVITLPPGVYRLTQQGTNTQGGDLDVFWRGEGFSPGLDIRTLDRNSAPALTVIEGGWSGTSEDPKDRLIEVLKGAILSIENVTLRYGDTAGSGGAIHSLGELTVVNSILHSDKAGRGGGLNDDRTYISVPVTAA